MLDRMAPAVLLAVAGVVFAGCGSSTDYAKDPRPAAVITVGVGISPGAVLVTPGSFGAGQIELVVANNTQASQQLTLTSSQPGVLREQTGPINPGDTATLQAQLQRGTYQVRVEDPSVKPAQFTVGAPRTSAQNQLLQP
jgi:hypothetical protein